MELEEAIQTLKDFAKYGRYYSNNTEHHMKTAIETVLNYLKQKEHELNSQKNYCKMIEEQKDDIIKSMAERMSKQEKIIELMSRFIDTEFSSEHLSKVLEVEVKPLETYREDIKQYFEKKAEEVD